MPLSVVGNQFKQSKYLTVRELSNKLKCLHFVEYHGRHEVVSHLLQWEHNLNTLLSILDSKYLSNICTYVKSNKNKREE